MSDHAYMSLSEVARRANAPVSRVKKASKAGLLKPDFVIGKVYAYRMERLPELINTLATEVI
jgi:hypothetical protein